MSEIIERLREALKATYRIDRQVGLGGMATVFLAEDLKHHRQVAIKVLRPELSATLGAERFLREIELAAKLQHPHIVPLYDSGTADGFFYYVMPFVEGESLRDLLQREGRLPLERAAQIVRETASGLAYAHKQGIVHRDIKPENIMLSGGHAVVADFGIARAVDASREENSGLTGVGMAIGTPAYMSPEQATADEVDARSDQYALACVFYEMVSGKQAFTAPTMQALLTKVLTGARPKLSSVVQDAPPEVDAAVQRALAQDPKARFPDVMAFADALLKESSGVAAAGRESRRWKRLAVALPVAVAVLAIVWVAVSAPKRTVVSGAETIAVLPFSTSGADVATLSEGMVDLVGGNLDGVGGIRTIESRQVIRAWQHRVKGGGSATIDDAIAIGRGVKAASVLMGSIVSTGGNARLTAELYDLSGKQLARAQVDGKADSVLVLADRLALEVLRGIWKSREPLPSARASAINSTSVEAIRAYLDGERWYRSGVWDSAAIAYQHAVQSDSTFAIAWYKLASALGWQAQITTPEATGASANAVKYSEGLSPRLHTIMVAYQLFQHGNRDAVDSMLSYTAKYPDDADGWDLLGEAQYHTRGIVALTPAELVAPFDRVIAIDSSLTAAAIHPMEIALQESDTALIRRYLRVFQSAKATTEARHAEAGLAILADPKAPVDTIFPRLEFSSEARATLVGLMLGPTHGSVEQVERAIEAAMATAAPADRIQLLATLGLVRGGTGQQAGAVAISDSFKTSSLDYYQFLRMVPFYGNFTSDTLNQALKNGLAKAPPGNPFVDLLRGVYAYDTGDVPRMQAAIQAGLAVAGGPNYPPWLRGTLVALDGLRMVAQGDTTGGLAKADAGIRSTGGFGTPPFVAMVSLRIAQLQVTRPATREEGIKRLRYGFLDRVELLPIIQYDLAKVYDAAGDKPNAIAAYGQFVRLWGKADPDYQPRLNEAKAALQRLTAEGTK